MSDVDGLLKDFLEESYENLDQADQDFVVLERNPSDTETLASIFRTVHTIKGSCGFLGFGRLEKLAHTGENLLGLLREGEMAINADITTTLLEMVDQVRAALGVIESTGEESEETYPDLIKRLEDLHAGDTTPGTPPPPAEPEQAPALATPADDDADDIVQDFLWQANESLDAVDAAFTVLDANIEDDAALASASDAMAVMRDRLAFVGLEALASLCKSSEILMRRVAASGDGIDPNRTNVILDVAATLGEVIAVIEVTGDIEEPNTDDLENSLTQLQEGLPEVDLPDVPTPPIVSPVVETPAAVESEPAPSQEPPSEVAAVDEPEHRDGVEQEAVTRASSAETKIRVDVHLLDRLMNQVGELVLSRNQIMQHISDATRDKTITNMSQRLSQITTELQESIMMTRLQPIDTVWSRLPRMVRDLSLSLGKQVRLKMEGGHTELDRTLIESIRDPMIHLVRNALDHGIEVSDARTAAGKPAEGTLTLRAYHEGGQVNIEIVDDGGGIDATKVGQKALQKGLITSEQAEGLTDREKFNLIFEPGFSTAEQITNVSGRGVGMDVVKTHIERINGLIEIQSVVGRGTTIKVKIPLTLAIIPALVVACDGDRYAIPQASLVAIVQLNGDEIRAGIEHIHNAVVYRWRGRLLPLVGLRDILGLSAPDDLQKVTIVVLQVEDQLFGLVVDQVLDSGEIVVKPLGKQLMRIPVYAGATIMGDGHAAIILDVLGLAESADILSPTDGRFGADDVEDEAPVGDATMVLIVEEQGKRFAMRVDESLRLERFPCDVVEHGGHYPVVQYRGKIVPLISLANGQAVIDDQPDGRLNVVVHAGDDGYVGLVVDELIDIVNERFELQAGGDGTAVVGTAIIQGRVAEVVDPARIPKTIRLEPAG
jgi:two-component system, chemotaxis family, sensor kinase CheA